MVGCVLGGAIFVNEYRSAYTCLRAIPTIVILCDTHSINFSFIFFSLTFACACGQEHIKVNNFQHYRTFDILNNTKFNAESIFFIFYSHQKLSSPNIFKFSLSIQQQQQQQQYHHLENKLFFFSFLF